MDKNENGNYDVSVFKQEEMEAEGAALDGFNLEDIKLSQDFASGAGVKKLITTIPVRKPDKQHFFRINTDPEYELTVATIELKAENETYIVHPGIASGLVGEVKIQKLCVGITRHKVLFVWALTLPGADGKINPWHQSALEACERAKHNWIRMVANMDLGAYEIYEATARLEEPQWPELAMEELLNIAFKGKFINTDDHPVLRQLRGEI